MEALPSFGTVKGNLFSVSGHIRQYRFRFGFVICIGLLNHIVSFLLPISIGEYFTLFFQEETTKGRLLHWMGFQFISIDGFFLFFFGLLLLKGIFTFLESFKTSQLGELFVKNIRERVFSLQIHTPTEVFLKRSYGKYLLRYSNDLKSVQNLLSRGYIEGIRSTLFLCLGLMLMGHIHLKLTLLLIIWLCVSFTLIVAFTRWQTIRIQNSRSHRSGMLAYVARQFARYERLKQRNEEVKVTTQFNEKSTILYASNMRFNITESGLLALVPLIILGSVGVLLWCMVFLKASISAGDGFMLILILLMMEGGIRRLLRVPGYLNKGKISLRKIEKMVLVHPSETVLVAAPD